jgi:hypothetical protein
VSLLFQCYFLCLGRNHRPLPAVSSWMKALACALEEILSDNVDRLFKQSEHKENMQSNQLTVVLA